MKKEIMKQAWVIAKEMAVELGGSSKQHLSAAMKQAWAEAKAVTTVTTETVEAIEVVEVVEVAPVEEVKAAAPKAPKKKKKSTGGVDFAKWCAGNSAGRTKGAAVVRRTETAAERKARRAANADMYTSKPKRTTKAKTGADIATEYTRGLVQVSTGH